MALQLGGKAPDFQLPGVDGKHYSLETFANKLLLGVVFSCNHCPYVKAYEDRLISIQKQFAAKGLALVAINANDDKNYPDDSFDRMVLRAREKGFNFPYLRDETQATAKAYAASRTPHIFLLDKDRQLRYTGAIDDNWEHPGRVKQNYLIDAIEALLKNEDPPRKETFPVGCSIKWRPDK